MTRVSCNRDDPGYSQYTAAKSNNKNIIVLLDGAEVHYCSVADDELGFVVRCVLDENGRIQVDPNDSGRIWEERLTGEVEIKFEDESVQD